MVSFGLLIFYAKLVTDSFSVVVFSNTHRLGNFVTHNLAKYAKHVSGLSVWMEDISQHINDVLLVDYAFFFSLIKRLLSSSENNNNNNK